MSDISQAQAAQQGNRTTDGKYTFATHAEPEGLTLSEDPFGSAQMRAAHADLDSRRQELKSAQKNMKRKQGFLNKVSGRSRRAEKALTIAEQEFGNALTSVNRSRTGPANE